MLDLYCVHRKTPKGELALLSRSPNLGLRMRSLMILIDGTRTVGDLLSLRLPLADYEQALQELLAQGFIERRPTPEDTGWTELELSPSQFGGDTATMDLPDAADPQPWCRIASVMDPKRAFVRPDFELE